jgi:DNA-binding NarL/FixJ family response regulator
VVAGSLGAVTREAGSGADAADVTGSEAVGKPDADATRESGADAADVTGREAVGKPDADATGSAESRRRLAVVVDELALVRLGLATVLHSFEVEVVAETPGGREAAELARLHQPELLVVGSPSDMPVVEAVRRARAGSDGLKIVALVGAGRMGTVAGVVGAGSDGVAPRGAAPGDLAEALEAVLAGRRYVAATLSSGLLGQLHSVATPAADDVLTYREREVLALLAGGASNREIAADLSVTLATVKSHLVHVYAKLEVRNRHEALSRAVGLGLLA